MEVISVSFWLVLIIGGIFWFVRRNRRMPPLQSDERWYLRLALSRQDAIAQVYFLLAVLFFGALLLTLNQKFGSHFSWRTILLATSLVGLVCAYRLKLVYTLAAGILGSVIWWTAQAVEWGSLPAGQTVRSVALTVGLLIIAVWLYLLGRLHEQYPPYRRFALVYELLGMLGATAGLLIFSTRSGLQEFEQMLTGLPVTAVWPLAVSLLVIFAGAVLLIGLSIKRRAMSIGESVGVIIFVGLFGLMLFAPASELFLKEKIFAWVRTTESFTAAGMIWAVVFNLAVFLQILGLMLSGYVRREEWLINLSAILMFLLIAIKYFDWFFTFLDKSVFFIGAGILLFVVGWLMERGRRYVLNAAEHSHEL